jgi:diguanylate cyclase (GGDEF)-like protein/PAS domain S-box-containing protein
MARKSKDSDVVVADDDQEEEAEEGFAADEFGGQPGDEYTFWLLFASLPIGLMEARQDGNIRVFNAAAVEILLNTVQTSESPSHLDRYFMAPEHWESLLEDLNRTGVVKGQEVLLQREEGSQFWAQIDARVALPPGGESRIFFAIQDISARKEHEDRLREIAGSDPMTGLPHRAALMEVVKREVARMRRDLTHRFAVGFIDLDNFKDVNDTHGHLVGDQLLMSVAHRLKRGLRPEDTVFRYGGDEFAVVLQGVTDVASARIVGSRMLDVINAPFRIQDLVLSASASVGIRLCTSPNQDTYELIHSADRAMYAAKKLSDEEGTQRLAVV